MVVDYTKLIKDYLTLHFAIKKKINSLREYITAENKKIAAKEKVLTKLNLDQSILKKNQIQIRELKNNLKVFIETENKIIDEMQQRLAFLKNIVSTINICFEDVLKAVFPDYSSKKYTITCSNIFTLKARKPLSTSNLLSYYENTFSNESITFLTITVINKENKTSINFYKFFNLDEVMEDGTLFKNNLISNSSKIPNSNYFENHLLFDTSKIHLMPLSVLDFKYNAECQLNIDKIVYLTKIRNKNKGNNPVR